MGPESEETWRDESIVSVIVNSSSTLSLLLKRRRCYYSLRLFEEQGCWLLQLESSFASLERDNKSIEHRALSPPRGSSTSSWLLTKEIMQVGRV